MLLLLYGVFWTKEHILNKNQISLRQNKTENTTYTHRYESKVRSVMCVVRFLPLHPKYNAQVFPVDTSGQKTNN
jgi:hypothetical protein